jgi:hypothetical protein
MAVIVSTNETVLPVTKKKLFDYVRFQTRMSNPDLLSDTDLCAIATISEQNEARARKFIQKQATVTWAVTDTDAELPSDFYEPISYKRGDSRVDVPLLSIQGFNETVSGDVVSIRFDGISQKLFLPSAVTETFNDYLTYVSVPNYDDPSAWTPSYGQTWFPIMSTLLIIDVFEWIYLNTSTQISDLQRALAKEAIPLWMRKYNQASKGITPRTTNNANFKGSY